jgi:hypothetical protein
MEATYSSETSVDFRRNTRHYIPEDRTLQNSLNLIVFALMSTKLYGIHWYKKQQTKKIQASNEYPAYKLIDTHREFFSKLPTGILMRGIDLLF